MNGVLRLLKRLHTPVTIMLVPHTRTGSFNVRMPAIALLAGLLFSCVGTVYTVSLSFHAVEYWRMKRKMAQVTAEFDQMKETMSSLRESESQFRKLFSVSTKGEVLKKVGQEPDADAEGSIDVEALKREVEASMESVREISEYLRKAKDAYASTPRGWPADGRLSSHFGMRDHPKYHTRKFHSGIDISLPTGSPIRATADGVVSFSGRSGGNGNIVVLEHGHGFSSVYAHNSRNAVAAGKPVKKGEVIAYAGSTGVATGSHLHYEVWKNGKSVNPRDYLGN